MPGPGVHHSTMLHSGSCVQLILPFGEGKRAESYKTTVSQLDMNVSAKKKIWAKLKIFYCQLAFSPFNCHAESPYSNSRPLTIHPPTFITSICVRRISRLVMIGSASKAVWDLLNRGISAFGKVLHLDSFYFIHVEGIGKGLRL